MKASSPRNRRLFGALATLLMLSMAFPVSARERSIEIQGLLVQDDLTGKKLEKKALKSGIKIAHRFRTLSGFYVLRAPNLDFWEDSMAPALADAMDSDKPIEGLRSTLLGMEELLIAGPDDAGVRVVWESPGERGQGFFNVVAPILIGPDSNLTGHSDANRMRVVTGWFVDETDDDPIIEAVGLKSRLDPWTGGDVRLPKLSPLPDRGEGAWVKYKGRSIDDEGEDMAKSVRSVERLSERDYIAADRSLSWPQESGEALKDTLTSARYRTRAPEVERGETLKILRGDFVEDWDWETKKVKHPTRYGIATLTVNAEDEKGDELAEVYAFVYFYTPLFVPFDAAHLYVGTSPEFFAGAVQKGEIPFFEREGEPSFYLGDLDRWISGEGLEPLERSMSRRLVEKTAERWTREMDGRDARTVQGLAKNPLHWPLRAVAQGEDEDRPFKLLVYKDDLVSWWRRFETSLRPDELEWEDGEWTIEYSAEATSVDIGVLFQGEAGEFAITDAAADLEDERSQKLAARETAGLSDKERRRVEEERAREDKERSAADRERAREEEARASAKRKEDQRKEDEERRREEARIAQANAPIDVRLLDVFVGARQEGKAYLATRAGKSLQIKVSYDVEGQVSGHTVQVVAQAFDRYGNEIPDFVVTSTKKTPVVGTNETTTWLKIPSNYTTEDRLGSYRVLTSVEVDGVPLRGEREEFVHIGSPLALKRIELDPSVVLPGEEAILLMDVQVGGWSIEDDVPLKVDLSYTVGDTTETDSFNMTRSIGFHELEVDVDVPEGLPSGDGSYTVTVSHESGAKVSSKGTLRVFAKSVVDEDEDDGGGRGRRRRVVEDEDDEIAAMAEKSGRLDEDDDRDVVRREDKYDDSEDFDFDSAEEDDEDSDEEPPKSKARDEDDDEDEFADQDEDSDQEDDFGDEDEDEDDFDDEDDSGAEDEDEDDFGDEDEDEDDFGDEDEDEDEDEDDFDNEDDFDDEDDEDDEDDFDDEPEQDARPAQDDRRKKNNNKKAQADKRRKDDERKRAEAEKRKRAEDDERKRAEYEAAKRDEERKKAEADKRRQDDERAKAEAAKADEDDEDDLDLDDEDLDLDSGDDEPRREEKPKKEEKYVDDFDWDNMPENIFFEDEEEEVAMWAEADGAGIIRVYGDASLDRMGKWYAEYQKAYGNGAPEWLFLCYEGDRKPLLRFSRYSTKDNEWLVVHQSPIKFESRDQEKGALELMKQVFEGFVPERKKKVPFGKL
jgi:hypothetical protein